MLKKFMQYLIFSFAMLALFDVSFKYIVYIRLYERSSDKIKLKLYPSAKLYRGYGPDHIEWYEVSIKYAMKMYIANLKSDVSGFYYALEIENDDLLKAYCIWSFRKLDFVPRYPPSSECLPQKVRGAQNSE